MSERGQRVGRKRRLRPRRVVLVLALGAVPVVALSFCVGGPAYYSAKYARAPDPRDGVDGRGRPRALPGAIEPERQVEGHTCGLHAMSSLYRAYGLDPEARRLRFRLGTDKPASNFAPDSRGTIHPDLLRVLEQDGFETELEFLKEKDAQDRLRAHLDGGEYAIALIRAPALHWVVLCGREEGAAGDEVRVCDSLEKSVYVRPLEGYLRERVENLVLVSVR